MTSQAEGRYLFTHSWEREGERLTALAGAFDPITRRHLLARGLTDGWRCLEVGAGTGTIAGWLAETVGPKGRVLATDISLELMRREGVAAGNLELRRHDILADPLPDEEFDLVHCRLVLEHLPGRLDGLARMTQVLAPGGWLVVEDMTFGTERATTRRGAATITGVVQALKLVLRRHGHDAGFGAASPFTSPTSASPRSARREPSSCSSAAHRASTGRSRRSPGSATSSSTTTAPSPPAPSTAPSKPRRRCEGRPSAGSTSSSGC